MPLYCSGCDDFYFYGNFKGKPKVCPVSGQKLEYYADKHDAPRGERCCDCALIHTSGCCPGSNVRWTPTAFFYAKPCDRFRKRGVKT